MHKLTKATGRPRKAAGVIAVGVLAAAVGTVGLGYASMPAPGSAVTHSATPSPAASDPIYPTATPSAAVGRPSDFTPPVAAVHGQAVIGISDRVTHKTAGRMGMIVTPAGLVVTAADPQLEAPAAPDITVSVGDPGHRRAYPARLVGADTATGLAVLQIEDLLGRALPTVTLEAPAPTTSSPVYTSAGWTTARLSGRTRIVTLGESAPADLGSAIVTADGAVVGTEARPAGVTSAAVAAAVDRIAGTVIPVHRIDGKPAAK